MVHIRQMLVALALLAATGAHAQQTFNWFSPLESNSQSTISSLQTDGKVNPIASIMVTVLAEMANIERSNIQYRLNSGRANYIANGGILGRKRGSTKSEDRLREEYKETIALLKKGYSVRNVAKLQGIGISTVQRIKNQFINNK